MRSTVRPTPPTTLDHRSTSSSTPSPTAPHALSQHVPRVGRSLARSRSPTGRLALTRDDPHETRGRCKESDYRDDHAEPSTKCKRDKHNREIPDEDEPPLPGSGKTPSIAEAFRREPVVRAPSRFVIASNAYRLPRWWRPRSARSGGREFPYGDALTRSFPCLAGRGRYRRRHRRAGGVANPRRSGFGADR